MSPTAGDRVALYIRVSTDKQVDEGHSLDGQRLRLLQLCEAKGYVVTDVVVDSGESAGTLDRPGVQTLRQMAASGRIDAVLVTKPDRLSRNLRDLLNFAAEMSAQQVSIATVDGTFDTASAFGKAMSQMQGVFAELERELIRERTREGMANARAKGVRLGRPPLGYTADPDVPGGLVPTDDAPIFDARRRAIRDAIATCQSNGVTSWPRIAAHLNSERIPTITGKVGTWDHKRAKSASDRTV